MDHRCPKNPSVDTRTDDDCAKYLGDIGAEGKKCYGPDNIDTKGGTWQVGSEDVSYHALGSKVPPEQYSFNKLFGGSALKTQSVNIGNGAPLNPWPFDALNDVQPTTCHSHNDYERDIPLFSAMSAGCIGIEADVWLVGGQLVISHENPSFFFFFERPLREQYIDPLKAILDHNNGGSSGDKGVYPGKPEQSITLLIDFKTGGDNTFDAVNDAVQPLRDAGYLSRVENGNFVEKQVTIVLSGKADFDRINSGDENNRDMFYDAHIDKWEDKYNSKNSFYASSNFKSTIGNPGSPDKFSDEEKQKVTDQVGQAHGAGLKVRYCEYLHVHGQLHLKHRCVSHSPHR